MKTSEPPVRTKEMLTCTVLRDAAEVAALCPEWLRLLENAERSELTQSPAWLLTWWRVYGGLDARQLQFGLFHDGDRLVGLAPLLRRRYWYGGCLPFRRLELLASGEPAEQGIYSNHLSVIAERDAEARVAASLTQAISDGMFGSWDEVILPMMSGDTPWPGLLVGAFHATGVRAKATVTCRAPFIPLPKTWDEYLAGLPSGARRRIQHSLKEFETWANGPLELQCYSGLSELEIGKSILIQLHHERWGAENQRGVFRLSLYRQFHDEMMRTLADGGSLEILVLRARGQPFAAVYNMVWAGKVYSYQAGRRTDLPKKLRPGVVLDALAIRRSIELGRREFDLLADEAPYKAQLTGHTRPQIQVRATRPSFVEIVRKFGVSSKGILSKLRNSVRRSEGSSGGVSRFSHSGSPTEPGSAGVAVRGES